MKLSVTKKFNFCYGHHLPEYGGKCRRYHGHNAELEVTICHPHGNVSISAEAYPGMVADFSGIKKQIEPILEKLDHFDLNTVLGNAYLPPTAENIAKYIWDEIVTATWFSTSLYRIRLSETPDSWVTLERSR